MNVQQAIKYLCVFGFLAVYVALWGYLLRPSILWAAQTPPAAGNSVHSVKVILEEAQSMAYGTGEGEPGASIAKQQGDDNLGISSIILYEHTA